MKALKVLGLVLLLASPLLSQPPGPPISPGSSGGSGTVTNTDATCADTQIIRADGASNTATQCSALTVADTTGNLTGPSGGFSIIGGTAATADLILDGSTGTAGYATILEEGSVYSTSSFTIDLDAPGGDYSAQLGSGSGLGSLFLYPSGRLYSAAANGLMVRNATTAQKFEVYGTSDATVTTYTNYERLSLSCDGTADCTIATETAGTGGDDVVLTVKGEGPAGTLVLDGSDDVAGSVTVSAAGALTVNENISGTISFLDLQESGSGAVRVFANMQLLNNKVLGFSDNTDIPDTAIARASAGVLKVTNYSTGMGSLLSLRKVTPDIDGETTTAAQSGTVWTNTGDGDGEAITLLNDPTIGVQYCFAVDVAQTITVAPSTGETLYYGTDQCVVSLTSNSIGSTLCVTAITGGSGAKWFTMSDKGAWTCND